MDSSSVEHKEGPLPWWLGPLALTVVVLAGMTFAYSRLPVAGSSTTGSNVNNADNGSGSGGEPSALGVGSSQTVEGNGVSITLRWQGKAEGVGPVFSVAMDTHSGSLDGYDLSRLAVLRTSSGQEITPVSWDSPSGGHHRRGTLTFASTGRDGNPVADVGSGPIRVIIKDVAGVAERMFTWTP